jgi:hypothetical protein
MRRGEFVFVINKLLGKLHHKARDKLERILKIDPLLMWGIMGKGNLNFNGIDGRIITKWVVFVMT